MDLITNVTASGTGAAVGPLTGPCSLHLKGGSTFSPNTKIDIQVSETDSSADFGPTEYTFRNTRRQTKNIAIQSGSYYLRAVTDTEGESGTSVTIEIIGGA